jgi:hypothetical protein
MNAEQIEREWLRGCSCAAAAKPWQCSECTTAMRSAMTKVCDGRRFYVWQDGWAVRSGWRIIAPDGAGRVWDCTGMDDTEFDQLMRDLQEQEQRFTEPTC